MPYLHAWCSYRRDVHGCISAYKRQRWVQRNGFLQGMPTFYVYRPRMTTGLGSFFVRREIVDLAANGRRSKNLSRVVWAACWAAVARVVLGGESGLKGLSPR